jgi:hypothetical protein
LNYGKRNIFEELLCTPFTFLTEIVSDRNSLENISANVSDRNVRDDVTLSQLLIFGFRTIYYLGIMLHIVPPLLLLLLLFEQSFGDLNVPN